MCDEQSRDELINAMAKTSLPSSIPVVVVIAPWSLVEGELRAPVMRPRHRIVDGQPVGIVAIRHAVTRCATPASSARLSFAGRLDVPRRRLLGRQPSPSGRFQTWSGHPDVEQEVGVSIRPPHRIELV